LKKQIFPSMTKDAIQKRISWILKNYAGGTFLEGMDEKLALALLDNHPNAAEKKGCGVKTIMIVDDGPRRGKHFEIHRIDGSHIDFSYRACLRGSTKQLDRFRLACRTAVKHDTMGFRDEALKGNPVCRHRGIPLTKENSIVDHVKPKTFNMLVANFVGKEGIDIDHVEIGGDMLREFIDQSIARKFRKYHNENATLELVYWEANNEECR